MSLKLRSKNVWGRLGMGYETYRIADLIDEIAMGPFGSNIKVSCFVDSGVPVLNGSNLEGFSLSEKTFRYVTREKADSLNKANAHRGDIVITHRGTLGQIVFIPQDSKYDRYVISQSQFRVRCNDKVLPEYLVYYFHTPIGQHKLLSNASQVGVPALARPSSTFQQIEVVLPELSIQKRVVEIISTIQKKIVNNQELNDNLLDQAQTLYKQHFPYSVQDDLPDGWRIGTVGEIIEIHDSKRIPLSGADRMKMEKKIYPYYGAASLMDYVDNYIFDGKYLLLGEDGTVVDDAGYPILQYVWGQFWVNNHAHILTGVMYGTPLAYDDVAGYGSLSGEDLHAQAFAFRITAVLGTTDTFLVCHLLSLFFLVRRIWFPALFLKPRCR